MTKPIAYPSVSNASYKGIVSEMRTALNILARRIARSPGAANDIRNQISAFLANVGITPLLPANQAIVTSTVKVLMPAATGSYTNGYTFTVVNGVITAVVAS
ncbi:hypothetical protein [Rhizobium phage RHEph27]|uniref:Uncharacterized protein n=1 Tax=Rhizobium phage RHph_Y1_20 TaxID=2509571 RepID=A0A7S5R415_9CAUD|nr:hypothetical protein EVB57_049 [Rhizobium phage RHph_Y1_20]QXV75004.1 hypothetical protein [Rhizobium phage RHEph27]